MRRPHSNEKEKALIKNTVKQTYLVSSLRSEK